MGAVFRGSDDVERFCAELFPAGRRGDSSETRAPLDAYVLDDDPPRLTVELALAGADPSEVDVSLHEDVLVVRGTRRRGGPEGRRVYQHAEIAWGPFERRLRLNVAVDGSAASASWERGLLRVSLPLAPRTPTRHVEISVREGG